MKRILIIALAFMGLTVTTSLSLIPVVYAATPSEQLRQNSQCTGEGCVPVFNENEYCENGGGDNRCNPDLIAKYLNPIITLMGILVGIAVTIGIALGGIQYTTSEGDPQKAAAAKSRIKNSLIALVAFFFLYATIRFLLPGSNGLFRV